MIKVPATGSRDLGLGYCARRVIFLKKKKKVFGYKADSVEDSSDWELDFLSDDEEIRNENDGM